MSNRHRCPADRNLQRGLRYQISSPTIAGRGRAIPERETKSLPGSNHLSPLPARTVRHASIAKVAKVASPVRGSGTHDPTSPWEAHDPTRLDPAAARIPAMSEGGIRGMRRIACTPGHASAAGGLFVCSRASTPTYFGSTYSTYRL